MKINFYLIGGATRDYYLGLESTKDLDFVIVANSYAEMKQAILDKGGEIFVERENFLTIRGRLPNVGAADFVLARRDGVYSDHRRPDSVEVGSLYEDQKRREITINSIAKNIETGEIIDPFNGIQDCKDRIVRCIGNPVERLTEDAIRLLRIMRFHLTKNLTIDPQTLICLYKKELIDLLDNISEERIYDELTKCFKFDTLKTLKFLNNFEYLRDKLFSGKIWLRPTLEKK